MTNAIKNVVVTGGAGQIAYALLFRIANGDLLGKEQSINLHILDIPEALPALEGVRMELEDCAFPLLHEVVIGTDPKVIFKDADYALLVGAKPRGPGMERSDLLQENGKIFVEHGKAINESSSDDVKVLVVGNPCNTNCLIAMSYAPRIPRKNFFALTRLDQNRAQSLLAQKSNAHISEVKNVAIWGNHSSTQVPDFVNVKIRGHRAEEFIPDRDWLENTFISTVQKRGAAIIAARGKSSAASAANAVIDSICAINEPTQKDDWFSSGVCSDGNPYGIDENLIFSFPLTSQGKGKWKIVESAEWDDFLKEKIKTSEKELIEEREMVKHLLGENVKA